MMFSGIMATGGKMRFRWHPQDSGSDCGIPAIIGGIAIIGMLCSSALAATLAALMRDFTGACAMLIPFLLAWLGWKRWLDRCLPCWDDRPSLVIIRSDTENEYRLPHQ
jgi:hypothetical protein